MKFDRGTGLKSNFQKSNAGATFSIKTSRETIKIEDNKILSISLLLISLSIKFAEIIESINQLNPITIGTPNTLTPNVSPYLYSPKNNP